MKLSAFNNLLQEADFPGRSNYPGKGDDDVMVDRFIELIKAKGFNVHRPSANARLFIFDAGATSLDAYDFLDSLRYVISYGKVKCQLLRVCLVDELLPELDADFDSAEKFMDAWGRRVPNNVVITPPDGWHDDTYDALLFEP